MPPRAEAFALTPRGGGRLLALRSIVGLTGADPEKRTTWVHVGYVGEWAGHHEGPFALTPEDFASCVAQSERQATPIAWDYNHASLNDLSAESGRSAGYVQKLEVRGTDLYALTEFTPLAASMIRGGEYRFCSGVFDWANRDKKTGERTGCALKSIALTNYPFVDGQQPIALSARRLTATGAHMKIAKEDLLKEIKALDGDELEEAQVAALVAGILAMKAARDPKAAEADAPSGETELGLPQDAAEKPKVPLADGAAGGLASADANTDPVACAVPPVPPTPDAAATPPAAMADPIPPAGDPALLVVAKLAELTGLDNAKILAAIEANPDGIRQAFTGAPGAVLSAVLSERSTIAAELTKAKADLAAATKVTDQTTLEQEADALIKAGKWHPSSRVALMAMAKDAKALRALTADWPAVFPVGKDAPVAGPPTASTKNASDPKSLPSDHPKYVALAEPLRDRKGMGRFGPQDDALHAKWVDERVRDALAREMALTG